MPYRMHSEYLERLFLHNDLSEGRYRVDDRAISVSDISAPLFVVATQTDHIAPWRSVYKYNLYCEGDVTFLLTRGGHNAGIVSEPGHAGRSFKAAHRPAGGRYIDADHWFEQNAAHEGSWWPRWREWLDSQSGETAPPPAMGVGNEYFEDAPGRNVLAP
jgi:polyhydroxyalkanoate synthase